MKLNGDYIQDMAELQQYDCYSWGEDLIHVTEPNGDEYIVNKVTGKARKIVEARHPRRIDYAAVNRWTNCKNGIFALYWMLYPDGRYFADEDGFGMEDNDELSVCCIMNDNLEVLRPFTVVPDVRALLDQMIHEHHL